jgi:protoporphyrinogen oxidase
MSRIFYRGKFYSYPLREFEALMNLGVLTSALCMASYAWARLFPKRDVRSFEDWVVNQFGRRLYSIFFKTYTEKVWGMPCDAMSADWAAQRIKGLSLGKAVIDGLRRSLHLNRKPNDGMETKTLLESFRYPRKGPGMMWEAARDRVVEGGNRVLMGHALKAMTFNEGTQRWHVHATHEGETVTLNARHVISSAPMRELAGRIQPLPQAIPAAMDLHYRDFLTVALMIRSEDLFPEMVPDESIACVGLEYFCFEGDGLWSMSDDDLIALATRELVQLGLTRAEDVTGGAAVRQEKAYPDYDETYRDNVAELRAELEDRYPTLHLVGRNGMHLYNNQDHAMMTAMLTVRNIEAGARVYDIWNVNEDAEYHESGSEGESAALASERLVPEKLRAA